MKVIFLIMIGLSLLQADYIRDNTKKIVLDTTTNLMWQDDNDAKTITRDWSGAIDYCEALTLGDFSDWKLPNKNELHMLVDRSLHSPSLSPVFQNVSNSIYWSSTTLFLSPSFARIVYFNDGIDGRADKSDDTYYVRCVR